MRVGSILALMFCVGATPVLLAQETGTHIGPSPAQIPDGAGSRADIARQAMYNYAECAVKRSRARVEAYLATFPGSKEAHRKADGLAVDECLSTGHMTFKESLFRGGAYETLYRLDYRYKAPVVLTAVQPIDYSIGATADTYRDRDPDQTVALRNFADCVVRADTIGAHNLILSRAGYSKEAQSFTALTPQLQACLPKGVTLTFSKAVLRGLVGETLYRLSKIAHSTSLEKRGG